MLMEGRTSIVIAQRILTVENADQIIVLEQGRVVERGKHEELLARPGFYKELYELQQQEQDEAHSANLVRHQGGRSRMATRYEPDELLGKAYDPQIARRFPLWIRHAVQEADADLCPRDRGRNRRRPPASVSLQSRHQ
ncbi:MAG: hypothetical protein R2843_05705 [Thermomicrobiales bacterium]